MEYRFTKYDHTVLENVNKKWKRMAAHLKSHTFESFPFISFVSFLSNLKFSCSTNNIHEVAALFNNFMKK